MAQRVFTTGEACRLLRIRRHTLMYLEETGKIPPASKTGTGKRYYMLQDIRELRRVLRKVRKGKHDQADRH